MICGFCSQEQNFTPSKPCAFCGKQLTGGRKSHWEGGTGARNRIMLSKKDNKKHAGLEKTVSRKAAMKALQSGGNKKK